MKEKDFLKEHPSLKGQINTNEPYGYAPVKEWLSLSQVHETQLDKAKVLEVIEIPITFSERKRLENEFTNWAIKNNAEIGVFNAVRFILDNYKERLKKELGIE